MCVCVCVCVHKLIDKAPEHEDHYYTAEIQTQHVHRRMLNPLNAVRDHITGPSSHTWICRSDVSAVVLGGM